MKISTIDFALRACDDYGNFSFLVEDGDALVFERYANSFHGALLSLRSFLLSIKRDQYDYDCINAIDEEDYKREVIQAKKKISELFIFGKVISDEYKV